MYLSLLATGHRLHKYVIDLVDSPYVPFVQFVQGTFSALCIISSVDRQAAFWQEKRNKLLQSFSNPQKRKLQQRANQKKNPPADRNAGNVSLSGGARQKIVDMNSISKLAENCSFRHSISAAMQVNPHLFYKGQYRIIQTLGTLTMGCVAADAVRWRSRTGPQHHVEWQETGVVLRVLTFPGSGVGRVRVRGRGRTW
jgi:hypothetical protein